MREKQTNFKSLLKAFWTPDETETTFEEEIEASSLGLSEEDKKMLTKNLSRVSELEKELYTHNVEKTKSKSTKTKVEQNKSKQNEISENRVKTEKELDER